MSERGRAVIRYGLVGLAVVAICVVGYLGYWWLRGNSTTREAQVQQNTYGRQNALVEQVLDDIRDAETVGIPPAQRVAIVDQVCDAAAKLTGSIALPAHAAAFIAQECPA